MVYDISQELFSCRVYPGDPAPRREVLSRIAGGAVCNLSALSLCAHNGTHIDAPYHFIEGGRTVDALEPEIFLGPALVCAWTGDLDGPAAEACLRMAEEAGAGERLLLKGVCTVTAGAARVFASSPLRLLGVESQTVGPEAAPMEVHRILLGADKVLLEGLRLGAVPEGTYLLSALPLNLGGGDGAPCRAVLAEFNADPLRWAPR